MTDGGIYDGPDGPIHGSGRDVPENDGAGEPLYVQNERLREALKRIVGPSPCARHSLAVEWMRKIASDALDQANAKEG